MIGDDNFVGLKNTNASISIHNHIRRFPFFLALRTVMLVVVNHVVNQRAAWHGVATRKALVVGVAI